MLIGLRIYITSIIVWDIHANRNKLLGKTFKFRKSFIINDLELNFK